MSGFLSTPISRSPPPPRPTERSTTEIEISLNEKRPRGPLYGSVSWTIQSGPRPREVCMSPAGFVWLWLHNSHSNRWFRKYDLTKVAATFNYTVDRACVALPVPFFLSLLDRGWPLFSSFSLVWLEWLGYKGRLRGREVSRPNKTRNGRTAGEWWFD